MLSNEANVYAAVYRLLELVDKEQRERKTWKDDKEKEEGKACEDCRLLAQADFRLHDKFWQQTDDQLVTSSSSA